MTDTYRLTFNKPAVAQLLHTENGESADGLKVRIENGTVQFMPVRKDADDDDVLTLEHRSRGGVEALIEGSMAGELAETLTHPDGPFMTLNRVGGGWLGVDPHGKADAPSKFVPHVRLWNIGGAKPVAAKKPKRRNTVAQTPFDFDQTLQFLQKAKETVAEHAGLRRRGQPPRELRAARDALASFETMAIEVFPGIAEAHAILGDVLKRGSNVSNNDAPIRTRSAPSRQTRRPRQRADAA